MLAYLNSTQRLTTLAVFFATAMLSGCARGANINIINRSNTELTNVVATGSGFTQSIGSIPTGEQRSISVRMSGESALKLDFDANGKHHASAPQGYFEDSSNTKVIAIVSPNFAVTVNTN